ncbi:hypothetical protein G7074_25945 [Pedobacter sp. HDW13]|uniref:hypothetical protein n=1 Tax=Pedobacter sp. HDW13 TaxID=2714940 RepID=UPI00140916FA|nr:hypothetical protein [Pedobacter sp. HDW13]QIL42400.1 hypothetical protein G7074_25945 [Pedobacter sp. HDW13]
MKPFYLLLSVIVFASCSSLVSPDALFQRGWYYDLKSIKHVGLIYCYEPDGTLYYRTGPNGAKIRLKLESVKSVVRQAGKDSLVVLTYKGSDDKKFLGKWLATTPQRKFYLRYGSIMGYSGQNISNQTSLRSNVYVSQGEVLLFEEKGSTYPLDFSNYKQLVSSALSDEPLLSSEVMNSNFKFKALKELLIRYQTKKDNLASAASKP